MIDLFKKINNSDIPKELSICNNFLSDSAISDLIPYLEILNYTTHQKKMFKEFGYYLTTKFNKTTPIPDKFNIPNSVLSTDFDYLKILRLTKNLNYKYEVSDKFIKNNSIILIVGGDRVFSFEKNVLIRNGSLILFNNDINFIITSESKFNDRKINKQLCYILMYKKIIK